jgi:hypothetical protein
MPSPAVIKAATAVLAGAMVIPALAGCSVNVGVLQHRTISYPVSGQRALVVNAHVGSVQVTGGDSGLVWVTEHISFRGTVPVTTHRTSAGTLTLDSACPALETCSVSYGISVPRTMTVQVSDNVGTIRLESLSGQVTAHTNAGNIDLGSLSGPVEATDHAGSISGENISSPDATLRSSVGGVDVTFSVAPASVTAATGVGSVTLRVPGSASYNLSTSVAVGSATVGVTRSPTSPHAITASTGTGFITIEPTP